MSLNMVFLYRIVRPSFIAVVLEFLSSLKDHNGQLTWIDERGSSRSELPLGNMKPESKGGQTEVELFATIFKYTSPHNCPIFKYQDGIDESEKHS